MQRLFSMFPEGGPGAGLLLLRLSVALSLRFNPSDGLLKHALLALPAVGICLGALTPALAAMCCLLNVYDFIVMGGTTLPELGIRILTAGALMLLGPGAHSLDARLFGRRVVTLSPRRRNERG
ncbi:hypothetical protein [Vitiosangium sp. GDMCC 1.1324]|uniref:hypothetical protein n=1 Tax=Vitiosangium sp. (strain GDMCC 1.1324) TaxID=2138576 RepID=UPI000D3AAA79|nr:hypothetical protein [Vitiosangium sp. GDMCC 1.1324]PTL81357.1 hypothetical protein DAT35_24920 [Vitiosangium sp. GDMCC 1.1324]